MAARRLTLLALMALATALATALPACAQSAPDCMADVAYRDPAGRVTGSDRVPLQTLVESGQADDKGQRQVWVSVQDRLVGWTDAARMTKDHRRCSDLAARAAFQAGAQPCLLRWYQFDQAGKVTASDTFDIRKTQTLGGAALTERSVAALPAQLGLVQLRDPQAQGEAWFARSEVLAALRQLPLCTQADARQAATAAQPQREPTGNLKLLCQLQNGPAYVFVIDEPRQAVAVRLSTGGDWVTFRNGQETKQRLGDAWVAMVDTVRVDAAAIRLLREPKDDPTARAPQVSSNRDTNELVGLLGALVGMAATASSASIDRNSAVIRTGGNTVFPNNAAGVCEPWAGRRF